jgi:hypothetical protein
MYQVQVRGHLDQQWHDWFGGFSMSTDDRGPTTVIGPIADQAALHGLLRRIEELGVPLVSITDLDKENTQ